MTTLKKQLVRVRNNFFIRKVINYIKINFYLCGVKTLNNLHCSMLITSPL
jgi:hypothetical protein